MSGIVIVALWLLLATCFVPKRWWAQARSLLTPPRGGAIKPRTPDDHPDLTPVELTNRDRDMLTKLDTRTRWENAR
jgi:hypothetical protein